MTEYKFYHNWCVKQQYLSVFSNTSFYYHGELIDILSGKTLIVKNRYSHFGPLPDKYIAFKK